MARALRMLGLALALLAPAVTAAGNAWQLGAEAPVRFEVREEAMQGAGGPSFAGALVPVSAARAWALLADRLWLVDQRFEPLVTVALPSATTAATRVIAGDPVTGGVWLAEGAQVRAFDATGAPVRQWSAPAPVTAMLYAGPEALFTVAGTSVIRFDVEGRVRARVDNPLEPAPDGRLLLDPLAGLLWLAAGQRAVQFDVIAGLAARLDIDLQQPAAAAWLDAPTGELELLLGGRLQRIGRDGERRDVSAELPAVGGSTLDLPRIEAVPSVVVPRVRLESLEASLAAERRIALLYEATCDGAPCAALPAYLRGLQLRVTLGDRSLAEQFVANATGDGATAFVAVTDPEPGTLLRAELADTYGQVSPMLTVPLTGRGDTTPPVRAKANAPPTVVIASPANNATFVAPATIVVNATATDSDGTVAKVEFLRNGSVIATDTAAPWSATYANLAAGTYTLTARATDNAGASTTSAAVSVQVKANVAPSVALTAPVNNAVFTAPATIALAATAADSDGTIAKVEFFRGGTTLLGTASNGPYTYNWANVAAGTYALTAKATDDKGAATTSSVVNIIVNAPPTSALTAPAAGAVFIAPAAIVVTATASDPDGTIARVELYEGATRIYSGTVPPYTFTRTGATAGTYSYTAKAYDNRGAVTTSAARSVTVNANRPPAVAVTAPAVNATYVAPAGIAIAATASDPDGTVAKVEFFRDGVLLGADATSPYTYAWNNVAAGTYTLTAKATDDKGGSTVSAPVIVKVNANQPPTVALIAPTAGSIHDPPAAVPLAATATDGDGTVAKVEFFRAGTVRIATVTTPPYSYAWAGAPPGSHTLTAVATDDKGAATTSAPVTIAVSQPPSVAITAPVDGTTIPASAAVPVSVNAIDSDGSIAKVELFRDGALIGTRTAFPYDFSWNATVAGSYALTAKATDNRGIAATSLPVRVTVVANEAPQVGFDFPPDGGGYTGPVATIPVSLWAWDADGTVAKLELFSGATLLATFSGPPYEFAWTDVPTGTYALTAVATDDSGATTRTTPVMVKVIAPVVRIVAPADGATFVAPLSIPLVVSVFEDGADIAQVEYLQNGVTIGWGNVAPWNFTWTAVPAGNYLITARAYDSWGTSVESAPLRVIVNANKPPRIALEAPEEGAAFLINGATPIRLRAVATDGDGTIVQVRFFDGPDTLLGTVYAPPWEFTWVPPLALAQGPAASRRIEAEAIDDKGGAARAFANIHVVSDQPPGVALLAPAPNRTHWQPPPGTAVIIGKAQAFSPLSGPAAANTVRKVELLDGTAVVATLGAPNTDDGLYAFTLRNLPAGAHALSLRATDDAGFTATSLASTVAVRQPDVLPTVAISSPVTGQRFESRATLGLEGVAVPLAAVVSDPDGTVTKVEYVVNNDVVATVVAPPFAAAWNFVKDGDYTLVARATDDQGGVSTSAPVSFSVAKPRLAPMVALTEPAVCGTLSSAAPITFAADAYVIAAEIERVEFLLDGRVIGSAAAPPYRIGWANPVAGSFALQARAITTKGMSTSTPALTVVVAGANQPPEVAITAPGDGQLFNAPATIALSATATDPGGAVAKVQYFAGSAVVGTATAAPWIATWANPPAGTHVIVAKATDNQGATRTSPPVAIGVKSAVPAVNITSPAAGTRFAPGQPIAIAVQATTPGDTISRVEFLGDGALLGAVSFIAGAAAGTANFSWSGAGPGAHALTARVIGTSGASVVSAPVSVNIADLQIDIVEPRAGETFLAPANIRIGAAASVTGDTITQVDFLVDGVLAGSAMTAPYTFNWISSANGTHTVGAQARTASGLVTQARSASVTIAGAPAIAFDPGLDGMLVADDAAAIAGRVIAQANSAVTVNGQRAALGPDGMFFLDGVPLVPGANVLTVVVNSMDAPPVKSTLTVHRSATQPFAVQLDPVEGLAPLDATLTIVNRGGVAFKRIEIDTNDDATPETTLTALTGNEARLALKLAQPGIRTVRVTVFDPDDKVIYVARRRVRVIDPAELGARVLGVHRTMVARLAAGDVPGALRTFTGDAQARFQEIFTALGPDLPAAARQLGTFVDGVITETWAELTLARDTPASRQAFMIYLIRGGDGVWRQETM